MFADRLKTLREQRNIQQKQLAIDLGVTQQTVSKWENGIINPEQEKLIDIANYFEVPLDYLLGRSDEKYLNLYNQVFNNPDLKVFYENVSECTEEEMEQVLKIVEIMKKEEDKDK